MQRRLDNLASAIRQTFGAESKSLVPITGLNRTFTFARASTATFIDFEGLMKTAPSGCTLLEGFRSVQNLITSSASLASGSNVTLTLAAGDYTFSMGAGSGTATFSGTGGATGTLTANATNRTMVTITITAGTLVITASVATLVDLQLELVTGQTIKTASEYVSNGVLAAPYHGAGVDGFKWFDTTNGNTVNATVLTEAAGVLITNGQRGSSSGGFGRLYEPAATNLITYSGDKTQWIAYNVTVDSNVALDTFGNLLANKIKESVTSSVIHQVSKTFSATTGLNYCFWSIAKQAERKYISFTSNSAGFGLNDYATYDLQAGTVTDVGSSGSAGIVALINGWFLCWRTIPATSSGTFGFYITISTSPTPGRILTYAGTVGSGLYVADSQVEQGNYPTSLIQTGAATAPRSATVESFSASNINTLSGGLYLEFRPTHTPAGTIYFWGSYVNASNYTAILHDATNLIFRKRIAGTNYDTTIANAFTAYTLYKVAVSWGTFGTLIALNGALGTGQGNSTALQLGSTFQIGADGNGAGQPEAYITKPTIYQKQLTQANMAAMTL